MTGEQDRVIEWDEVVRFRLPADWRPDVEEHGVPGYNGDTVTSVPGGMIGAATTPAPAG